MAATITLDHAQERLAAQRGNLSACHEIARRGRTWFGWVARGRAYVIETNGVEVHRGTDLAAAVAAYNQAVTR